MKKYYLLFLILFLPFTVSAKEYCRVISGDGKNAGSEIECGTEHFYIIDSSGNNIRMLAKYNLLVGEGIYKEKIEKEAGDTRTDEQYCTDLAASYHATVRSDSFYNAPGYCFYTINFDNSYSLFIQNIYSEEEATNICSSSSTDFYDCNFSYYYTNTHSANCSCLPKSNHMQNEEAMSAHWDENDNYLYPQIGDTYISGSVSTPSNSSTPVDLVLDPSSSDKYNGYFWDLFVNSTPYVADKSYYSDFYKYLRSYLLALQELDFNITDVDLITLDDINNVILQNNKSLSYETLYSKTGSGAGPRYEFDFLQDYLTKQQEFLFNTTYWVRTGYNNILDDALGVKDVVFINSRGGICGSTVNRGNQQFYIPGTCNYTIESFGASTLGLGIRPVVTIPKEDIIYQIQTDVNDNGEIEVVENSLSGEVITFRATPKPGYKLMSVVIKRANGETIEISSEDLVENEDGTITVLNRFTMPSENVVIYARWISINELINPTTGSIFLFMILILSLVGIMYYKKTKESK